MGWGEEEGRNQDAPVNTRNLSLRQYHGQYVAGPVLGSVGGALNAHSKQRYIAPSEGGWSWHRVCPRRTAAWPREFHS